ncbi:hypothetical protein Q2378_26480, partial [Escherichia coli]|nr:hypothetical protein [Escherichia coli]
DSGMAGKTIPQLQQAGRGDPQNRGGLGEAGPADFPQNERAHGGGDLGKSPPLGPHKHKNDKKNSLPEGCLFLTTDAADDTQGG